MLKDILKRQTSAADYLPKYRYHVRETIVSLHDGSLIFTIRFKGVPFEVISDARLESNYDTLNNTVLTAAKQAGDRLAVWCHIDHYKTTFDSDYKFEYQWLQKFSDSYMQKFKSSDFFENFFYMSFVLKPSASATYEENIRELEELQLLISQALTMYEGDILSTYEHEGNLFSELYEFYAYLYNGFYERIPVTSDPMALCIPSSTLHHDFKTIETRTPDGDNRFTVYADLKGFPDPNEQGQLNAILSTPFAFVLAFSMKFLNVTAAIKKIDSTLNKMQSAGDAAIEQQQDMLEARGPVMAGQIYFGEFHGALSVSVDTPRQAEDRAAKLRITLSSNCGTTFVPATISSPETFFSLFPANFKHLPRVMPKTTRNLTGLFSMNTYSSGKQRGNPIGDGTAILPLQTTVNGIYHFNFHYSNENTDSRGEKRAGHTVILGATGAGKTTLQTTLLAFAARFGVGLFAIDKDGSMRGFIEALGGSYFTLRSNEPTGFNPFQFPDTPATRSFLYDLVGACARVGKSEPLSAYDVNQIKQAVDTVVELSDMSQRRFGALLNSIDDEYDNPQSLKARLGLWCVHTSGQYSYALDSPTNNFDAADFNRVGFDVSEFLVAGHAATEPILSVLFYLKTMIQKRGGLMATVVEEFWLPLQYPTTAKQIEDSLKTGRRRDEFILLVSQSPEDAIRSELLPTILQQTPTKIYLPNPDAEYETNTGGGYSRFGLTEKEYNTIKSLGLESRMFLVKQGSQSCVAKLDLSAQRETIAVLAMAADEFQYLDAAKADKGVHPDNWIPEYSRLRATAKKTKALS